MTLYAKWTPNSYTVHYDSNGGSGSTASSSHTYDEVKALTASGFTRIGYAFTGWATSTGGVAAYSNGQSVSNLTAGAGGTVTLYANWTPHTYTIHYDSNGGSGSTASSSHTYDEVKALTANSFMQIGYAFTGWAASAGGTVAYSDEQSVLNLTADSVGTVMLYANWTPHTYTIHYDSNGGSGSTASSNHTYDTAKALTPNGFTRTGYTFAGWATSAGGVAAYSGGQSVSNLTAEDGFTVTLYAKWTPNTYTVSYDANGGLGSTASSSHTYDAVKALTINGFTRPGYAFIGWATAADGTRVYEDMQPVGNLTAEDGTTVTLFAVWTANRQTAPTPRGTVVNCTSGVNIRSGPGTNYPIVGFAPKGATYLVIGQSGLWYKINFGGKVGYLSASYFSVSSQAPGLQQPPAPESWQGMIVNCNRSVNVRSGPGTNYAVIGAAPKGAAYTITGKSGMWYKIEFGGKTAYVSECYLRSNSSRFSS